MLLYIIWYTTVLIRTVQQEIRQRLTAEMKAALDLHVEHDQLRNSNKPSLEAENDPLQEDFLFFIHICVYMYIYIYIHTVI